MVNSITSGQLIDQNVLNEIIGAITTIQNNQYSSQSSVGDTSNADTSSTLQNGQWIVNTGLQSFTHNSQVANTIQSISKTITFKTAFKTSTQPIVIASVYSTQNSSAPIQTALSSVVITSTNATSFNFNVNIFSPTALTSSGFFIQYIAIGQPN